ncbi:MAG: hypothetical protein HKN42_15775 [Granulosicoccus sp.]|nr:hypothetical protein [Granulosicoccus sp.]
MQASGVVLASVLAGATLFFIAGIDRAYGAVDVTLKTEGVGDRVDQAPNLAEGGFAPAESKPRVQAFSANIDWTLDARTTLSTSVARHELNSLRDSFEINQIALSTFTRFSPRRVDYLLGVEVGLVVNHAHRLVKNSFTHYNGATLRHAAINQPQDLTLSAGLKGARLLGRGFSFSGNLSAGIVASDHNSMQGQGESSEGCQYAFETNGSTGRLQQQGVCGALVSYSQDFASEDGVEERLGFRSSQDVAYQARFVEAGGGLGWTHRTLSFSLGYSFRQYFRDRLDQRISSNGDTPTRVSQMARAVMAVRLGRRWTVSLASIYQSAPYLDEIPLLYTAFTSERYSAGDSLSFQLSATMHL